MTFLNPIALAWAAIAIPIVGLYILRIRRRRQVVPTLIFWNQIFQDSAPRSLWRRLRHWLSLMAQLAFMLLLVLALADPVSTGRSRRPVHYLLVLDQSASMRAKDGEPTRFDQAKQIAAGAVRGMREQDQATMIGAGPQPVIICGRTHHQPSLHRAIDAMAAADTPADLRAAVRLANSIHVGEEERAVLVISDAAGLASIDRELNNEVVTAACGRDSGNVGITALAIRPRADNPLEWQGLLRVANFTPTESHAEIRLTLNDELFDLVLMELTPGEEKTHTFRLIHNTGGILRARLMHDDVLPSDNLAAAILPAVEKKQVVLITEGDLFLESVLASHPWAEVKRAKPAEWEAAARDADILVFDSYVPDAIPHKPCLFLYPDKESRLWSVGEELKNPLVSDVTDDDSKLLTHVNLRNCTFHRARTITAKEPAKAMVFSFEHPLLLRWQAASPPVVLLAVNIKLGESDLPWRTAFPILMQNTLNYLSATADQSTSAYKTGETASLSFSADRATASDEQGRAVLLTAQAERMVVGPVASAGIVKVAAGERSTSLAFNLADSGESNLRHTSCTQPTSRPAKQWASASMWSWPWWVVLIIASIALSTVEWCLHQRRVID